MAKKLILKKREGDITKITINAADNGNRLSDEMAVQLTGMIDKASQDSRAILLRGAGENFCLGRAVMGERKGAHEAYEIRGKFEVVFGLYGAFRRCPVPVIGVVRGGAIGLGCALAGLCDMTIADASARFQLPEMGHNILPTMAMSALVDRVPRKALMYLVYSTEEIDAEKALIFGLASKVVPNGELDEAVDELVRALKNSPMPAVKGVKEFIGSSLNMDTQGVTDFARNLHATVNSFSGMRP